LETIAKIKIKWLSAMNGGRKILPSGRMYKPTLRFEDSNDLWSVALFLDDNMDGDFKDNDIVTVAFISDSFPYKKLKELKLFDITEGPLKVAEGILIDMLDVDI